MSITAFTLASGDVPRRYGAVARFYDMLHSIWLAIGGNGAVAAIQGGVAGALRPDMKILDAGCGTGMIARRLVDLEPTASFTLLDAAEEMLSRASNVRGVHIVGSVLELPFDDSEFDVVICSWVLETLGPARGRAIAELQRVLKPDGILCICHCSKPSSFVVRILSWPVRFIIRTFFAGEFLPAGTVAAELRGGGRELAFNGGLSTIAFARKE